LRYESQGSGAGLKLGNPKFSFGNRVSQALIKNLVSYLRPEGGFVAKVCR
jgi:hypothetical protein